MSEASEDNSKNISDEIEYDEVLDSFEREYKATPFSSDIDMLEHILKILYGREKKELADTLLKRFGSFHAIFDAGYDELNNVRGVTSRVATFFMMAKPSFRQALLRSAINTPLNNESVIAKYILSLFLIGKSTNEYMILLDNKYRVKEAVMLTDDDKVREAIGKACTSRAKHVILAKGVLYTTEIKPDAERLENAENIIRPLETLRIDVIDYVEYCPYRFINLRKMAAGYYGNTEIANADETPYECEIKFSDLFGKIINTVKNDK